MPVPSIEHDDLVAALKEAKEDILSFGSSQDYIVQSSTDENVLYYVLMPKMFDGPQYFCTCKGWRFTGGCKHIEKVKAYQDANKS